MPRRRMIDPFFWNDRKVGILSRDERTLLFGCVGQADDEGRLQADPASLKAVIFRYDADLDNNKVQELRDSLLSKMKEWPADHPYLLKLYTNTGDEYFALPNWGATNKPSHPVKSQLPAPPAETPPTPAREPQEEHQKTSGESPSQVRSGQVSLGKGRVGQGSSGEAHEDFTSCLKDEKDLTDRLTTTLTQTYARGPAAMVHVLDDLWQQATGQKMGDSVFNVAWEAVRKYKVSILAKAFAKAAKYKGGSYDPAKYLQKILDEQIEKDSEKYTRTRSP